MIATPRKILIIVVSRIGDTLFATPAIRAVAERFPDAELTVLAHPKRVEVLENLPFVARTGGITKNLARWRGWLPGRSFDLALVYGFDQPLVRYALRVAREVVAFEQADANLNARLAQAIKPPAFQSEHAVLQLCRLADALGAHATTHRLALSLQDSEIVALKARPEMAVALGARPLFGLQVASFPTKAYRDWPVENFAALCERLAARWPDAHFLIFGGGEERARTDWLTEQLGARATCLAGRLSLRQTAACMSLIDLYVGVDTGPTHIMSTFDVPMVAMYHCLSSAAHTGPLDHPRAFVIDHPETGQPGCSERTPMADITVEQVFERIVEALDKYPPRPRPA